PPDERSLEFPICSTPGDFRKSARKIRPLAKQRVAIIESVQPCNAPQLSPDDLPFNFNRILEILNDWARKDRHRRLHVTGSWYVGAAPIFKVPPGVSIANIQLTSTGFLEHENVIAIFDVKGHTEGMGVYANPN